MKTRRRQQKFHNASPEDHGENQNTSAVSHLLSSFGLGSDLRGEIDRHPESTRRRPVPGDLDDQSLGAAVRRGATPVQSGDAPMSVAKNGASRRLLHCLKESPHAITDMHWAHEPRRVSRWRASVLDCGSPLPLSHQSRNRRLAVCLRRRADPNLQSARGQAQSKTWRTFVAHD
jgi:hypothetical protein